jgi:hypothetical protein
MHQLEAGWCRCVRCGLEGASFKCTRRHYTHTKKQAHPDWCSEFEHGRRRPRVRDLELVRRNRRLIFSVEVQFQRHLVGRELRVRRDRNVGVHRSILGVHLHRQRRWPVARRVPAGRHDELSRREPAGQRAQVEPLALLHEPCVCHMVRLVEIRLGAKPIQNRQLLTAAATI